MMSFAVLNIGEGVTLKGLIFIVVVFLAGFVLAGCGPALGSAAASGQGAYMFVLASPGLASPRMGARLASGVASGLRRYGYTTAAIRDRSQYVQGHYLLELQTVSVRRIPFAQILDVTYEVTAGSPAPLHRGSQSRSSSMSTGRLVRGIASLIVQDVAGGMSARPR